MIRNKKLKNRVSELEKKYAALEERYNDSVQALTVITESLVRIAEQEIDMFDIDDKEITEKLQEVKNSVNERNALGFSRFEIKDGVPYLDGMKVRGCKSYSLKANSYPGFLEIGELDLKMTVEVLKKHARECYSRS